MKKKVCMVVPSFTAKGGITSVVSGYRNSQLTEDYDVRFIETYCEGNVIRKVSKALRAYFEFIYTTLVWKPNLVHVHTSFGGSFYRKALIIEMASLAKIPVINHVHGAEFDEFYRRKSQRKKKAIEKIYNKCIRTIALSEEWKKNLAEIVPEQTISVVENYGILQEDIIKEKFTKPNHKMILFLGFICERKGCLDIPASCRSLCRKIPMLGLFLVEVVKSKKSSRNSSTKYKDNVEFPGWIRNEQKAQYLREADIFLLPSYNEGMPMAILDAMGCGLPIVSTEVGGIPKIVRQGVNGYLYKPGDSKNMACAIIEYLTDDEKRLKAGRGKC
ncbi:MAG: glycosyltransferase family 4 protein [Lachnospiraceae bacterium]